MENNDRLDIDLIKKELTAEASGSKLVVYNSTSSTNEIAWQYATGSDNNSLVIFAEEQTAGKGRMGNKWLSRPAESILCSTLLLDLTIDAELIAITAAVATAAAIKRSTETIAKIKWPNDIILNDKKVAGILLESRMIDDKPVYVLGIGINCSQQPAFFENKDLQMPATSIEIETETKINRNKIAANLINALDEQLKKAADNPNEILDTWRSLSTLLGRRISVKYDKKTFTGNCIGIDPVEGLILQLEKGSVRMFHASQTRILYP